MKDFLKLLQKIKKISRNTFKTFLKKLKILLFIAVLLSFLTTVFYNVNKILKTEIANSQLLESPILAFQPKPYPRINSVLGISNYSKIFTEDITAETFLVMDSDSSVVLLSKNDNLRFSTASTAKIMTAITALEHFKMNDILTIKTAGVEGSKVGFVIGEKISFENLLYGMLLPSGNDAAIGIAQNYMGGEKAFIEKMNLNANKFHLVNTHFSDPSGLDDYGNYTTSLDLARLASIAIKNPIIAKVVNTKNKVISDIDNTRIYPIQNLNKLLGSYGVNGVKTGFTEEAGGLLVTSMKENGHTIIIVVMKSEDRFKDTEKILSLVSKKIIYNNF